MNELQKKFNSKVRAQMMKEFNYKGILAVPVIKKVSVNVGLSKAINDKAVMDDIINDLTLITGQKPVATKAKKAISGFKTRQGQDVGMIVTLRGRRMWDFVYRLIGATIPRIKDFQGISPKTIDRQGNLSIGIKEQLVFPEISPDNVNSILGMQINITTSASTKEEGLKLLRLIGFPIKEK